jgi:hypothetical protein
MTFAAAARDRLLAEPYVARCRAELALVEAEITQTINDRLQPAAPRGAGDRVAPDQSVSTTDTADSRP